jgi:hypothetical protein
VAGLGPKDLPVLPIACIDLSCTVGWRVSHFVAVSDNGRFFGLDRGDWSLLLGGLALSALTLLLS